jgi:hypothetical protein
MRREARWRSYGNLCHLLTRLTAQLKFSTGHVSAKALEDHVSRDELAFLVRLDNRRVQLLSRVAVKPRPHLIELTSCMSASAKQAAVRKMQLAAKLSALRQEPLPTAI